MTAAGAATAPIVISFSAGDDYYHRAAAQLRGDCDRLGIEHDIRRLDPAPGGEGWIALCRRKVGFCRDMLRRHGRPVLWIDVDCRLLRDPRPLLAGGGYDIAGFARGFRDLRDFDPVGHSRFFQPSILAFAPTPRGHALLDLMAEIEARSAVSATDDYFLQEAWKQLDRQPAVLLLPPDLVQDAGEPSPAMSSVGAAPVTPGGVAAMRKPAPAATDPAIADPRLASTADAGPMFFFGRSGNVSLHRQQAAQHEVEALTPARRRAVLLHEAAAAQKARNGADARVLLRRAYEIDPSDDGMALRYARALRRGKDLPGALDFLRKHQGEQFAADHARRFEADVAHEGGDLDHAQALFGALLATGTESDRAWAESRLMRLGTDLRARARGIADADRPALYWMETPWPGNVGDILNAWLIEKLSGIPPRHVPAAKGLLAVGSVVRLAGPESVVWGAGTPRMTDRLDPRARWLAVRGPLTRRLLLASGGDCPEIYGDPAWFAPMLYRPAPRAPRHKLGLVCHYDNAGEIVAGEGVKTISVLRAGYEGIEAFIDELHDCEAIVSSSLHGLILAQAYGIPARWVEVTDSAKGLPGDGCKFRDYFMTVGLDDAMPLRLPRGFVLTPDALAAALPPEAEGRPGLLPRRRIDLDALASVAPFALARSPRA
ncbi:polysaccharide pyruvyl transferase family protein [Derxia gummosa]|uniref:Polysaccharide pyruvyl transferase family protein n=1 Tax=Derxia gummosa DSM 723 TaxID=1121388 RepID=A0A8B6XA14_9BURK|nr:polysaccharide pyruvyl transferase family protein [Derxia gummosa]